MGVLTMKLLAVGLVLGAIGGAYLVERVRRRQYWQMTDAWLDTQKRLERQRGFEGVSFRGKFWDASKPAQAAPARPRQLRRRAS